MLQKIYLTLVFIIVSIISNGQVAVRYFESVPVYSSQTIRYSGNVVTVAGKTPLAGVEISVEEYGVVGYTLDNGSFGVDAPVNIGKLCFKKDGFIGASKVYVVDSMRYAVVDVQMYPLIFEEAEQSISNNGLLREAVQTISNPLFVKELSILKSGTITQVPETIRVLMPDNSVVGMSMDEYLKGVVPSEVPASWDVNALKAQAVAARSYASVNFKHSSSGADVCTTTHCQAWSSTQHDRTSLAVNETSKMSVQYSGYVINALFFSHCNGTTHTNESVWGGTPIPYLRSQSCGCGYTSHNAHGVGMCQYGARAMALGGSLWEDILMHYYAGTVINKPVATGTLKGVIYQGANAANLTNRIAGASVSVNTGQQVLSDATGLYVFELPAGQYTITATKTGFNSNSVAREITTGNTIWGSIQLASASTINQSGAQGVSVEPKITRDFVTVVAPGNARVLISDLSGSIRLIRVINDKATIDVGAWSSGIYIIQIVGSNYKVSEKIMLID